MKTSNPLLTVLWCATAIVAVSCRPPLTTAPFDLSKAKIGPHHSAVVIDGRRTSEGEWADSVKVPVHPRGSADLLWDERGLYVLFASPWPDGDPEALCLSVTSHHDSHNSPSVRFHMQQEDRNLELVKVVKGRDWRDPLLPPFDENRVRFASVTVGHQFGPIGAAELFMAWDMVDCRNGPSGKIFIHAYRLAIDRPTGLAAMQCGEQNGP